MRRLALRGMRNGRRARVALLIGLATAAMPARADMVIAPGAMVIDGFPVNCGSAPTYITGNALGDVAKGGPAGIFLNWEQIGGMPTGVKIFVYAHECSHVLFGGNENLADRFAIQLGKNQGWIDQTILNQICASVFFSPGDWSHLPGPARCAAMMAYYHAS